MWVSKGHFDMMAGVSLESAVGTLKQQSPRLYDHYWALIA